MHLLNECFDEIVVITVDPTRMSYFSLEAEYTILHGLVESDLRRLGYDVEHWGRLGCWASHMMALIRGNSEGKRMLMLEDDARLTGDVELLYDMPEDTELLFLGCGFEDPACRIDEGDWQQILPGGWFGTWAYGFTTLEAQEKFVHYAMRCPPGKHFDTYSRKYVDLIMRRPTRMIFTHDYHMESSTKWL